MSFPPTLSRHPRPWYVLDGLVDDYAKVAQEGGDLRMLRALKVIRSIIVNCAIIAISAYGLYTGGDPTFVSSIALVTLGLYNGVEVADYAALATAFAEVRDDGSD